MTILLYLIVMQNISVRFEHQYDFMLHTNLSLLKQIIIIYQVCASVVAVRRDDV
jgi:hypothetical protein